MPRGGRSWAAFPENQSNYFDGCEEGAEPVVLPPEDAVEPEVPFMASKTDMPCGPIVITTGFPSLVFACTTNDSATTFTSVNPAFFRSCWICCAAARL